ncbi:hypothetical protein LTR84_011523 [Exophiala bonariae]|uniref:AB hydrolase-1 domain-containing protein n=1 Tax=Exophiala bonariae TaxID=1690606 RepID=A0AAV9NGE7_9EURO|nr:hypothetical protein LTR84_011523 [Exophiala bonariae]
MPSVPPFSRSEKVEDYAKQCAPITWAERDIKSADGTAIKLLESRVNVSREKQDQSHKIVLYLQGNASSLPPRLPYLSSILRSLMANDSDEQQYTIIALSYRGYWKSKGRPSQQGIELDVEAALNWLLKQYDTRTKVIVWGQSIGAGAASVGLANLVKHCPGSANRISGLLLETPFVDLRTMLVALYPQKFLPYRYLAPFLLSTWDSKSAIKDIGGVRSGLRTLILEAGDDEIVPSGQGAILETLCKNEGMEVERATVPGALHTETMAKPRGRQHIVEFLKSF